MRRRHEPRALLYRSSDLVCRRHDCLSRMHGKGYRNTTSNRAGERHTESKQDPMAQRLRRTLLVAVKRLLAYFGFGPEESLPRPEQSTMPGSH